MPGNPGDGGDVHKPTLTVSESGGKRTLRWTVPKSQTISVWVLQTKTGDHWETEILPAGTRSQTLSSNVSVAAVTAVSRYRNMSSAAVRRF